MFRKKTSNGFSYTVFKSALQNCSTLRMSTTILVPKQDQPAYALEHFKISDLSALPADWNPYTHYPDGRPITPVHPPVDKATYETEDGAWIITQPPGADSPLPSPSAPDLIVAGDNLLIWDDAGTASVVDERNVGEIKAKHIQPMLVKLIKKVKSSTKKIAELSKRVRELEERLDVSAE